MAGFRSITDWVLTANVLASELVVSDFHFDDHLDVSLLTKEDAGNQRQHIWNMPSIHMRPEQTWFMNGIPQSVGSPWNKAVSGRIYSVGNSFPPDGSLRTSPQALMFDGTDASTM